MQQEEFSGSSSEATVELDMVVSSRPSHFEELSKKEDVPTEANLERVRDILFGSQARTVDKRIVRLEERISEELSTLREDIARKFEKTEAHLKNEIEAINQRLRGEERKRANENSELGLEVQKVSRVIARRLDEVDEAIATKERDLRNLVADSVRHLSEETSQRISELAGRLQRETSEVRDEKADRATLAGFFRELASQLGRDDSESV